MVILTLGAFRYSGIDSDIPSLPLNIEAGAIFDAVDTLRKFVFDGASWNEFVKGTGEINEMANVGVGTGLIFRDKIGVTFNIKSLIGGTNITVTDNLDDITITSTGTSPLTTKGDLLSFDTQDARLPVGTDGQILSANSAIAIGLEWIDNVTEVFSWSANHDMNGFAAEDSKFADGTDPTKLLALDLLNMTTGITLTLFSAQSTIQTLVIPDITQADTIATEKFPQLLASKTFESSSDFTAATGVTNFTGLGIQTQELDMGTNFIDVGEIATPSNPATDVGRLYVKDLSTVTTLFFRDASGTETNLLAGGGGSTVSGDVGYLAEKEFEGKLRTSEGFSSGNGTLTSLTANTGKDMYLARAKVTFFNNLDASSIQLGGKCALLINGTTVETGACTWQGGGGSGLTTVIYDFRNISHKVLAGQTILLTLSSISGETDIEGFIECFEEDTGVSPS